MTWTTTPAGWARRNFAINLALSFVLTAVVAGGVLFALRAASRAMRLSQMKSDFVSNVSHELRTPLSSIRVFGEYMRLGRVTKEEKSRERLRKGELGLDFYGLRAKLTELGVQFVDEG